MSLFAQHDEKLNMLQDAFFADEITVAGQEPFNGTVDLIPHEFSGVYDALAVIDMPLAAVPPYVKKQVVIQHKGKSWTVKFIKPEGNRAFIYLE